MKQEETIRVLVVEDHAQTRDGICDYLRQQGMIVNEAGNTGDGLLLVQEWQPHVVVLDIVLPQRRGATAPFNQGNGIEAARQIKAHNSGIGIVFLSAHPHFRADVLELAKEGYAGIVYLFKGEQPAHELRDAIYAARDGRFILDRKISRTSVPAPAALSHSLTSEEEEKIEFAVAQFNLLTERELEVVNYLVGSLTNAGIAQALVITPNAVQTHLRNVYAKVGLGDKDELLDKRSLLAKAYIVYQNRQGHRGNT